MYRGPYSAKHCNNWVWQNIVHNTDLKTQLKQPNLTQPLNQKSK